MSDIRSGHFVMLKGLVSRSDLNLRTARVLDESWTEAAQHPGRVPVQMLTVNNETGKEESPKKLQIWIKLENLEGPILDVAAMTAPPYNVMTPEERTETSLLLLPAPVAPAPPQPAPPQPACDFSDSEDEPEPEPASAPAPAPDRRAAARAFLQRMAADNDPRTHYCIYCGSEGPTGDKCVPCGFYRGTFCFPPRGGDTFMGRKLTFVQWPWTGAPKAPYVRNGRPESVPEFFERMLFELPRFYRNERKELPHPPRISDFEVGEVVDGPNPYEKMLAVSLTKPHHYNSNDDDDDEDDEDDDDDDADNAVEYGTTVTVLLKTYKTPCGNDNATLFLQDEHHSEHELRDVGFIPCPGGKPFSRDTDKAHEHMTVFDYEDDSYRQWRLPMTRVGGEDACTMLLEWMLAVWAFSLPLDLFQLRPPFWKAPRVHALPDARRARLAEHDWEGHVLCNLTSAE